MTGAAEYRERQRRFAEALAAADLDGAVVVSRGGSTFDRYAQVLYLTGHYQHYSYLPDRPGLFSGRAHTALVISAAGPAVLCISVPEIEASEIAVADIRCSPAFSDTVVGAIASLGLSSARVGLIGADVLPARYWRELNEREPNVTWTDCDEVLMRLRRIKSPAEQRIIREAAAIHRRGTTALLETVAAGRPESDVVAALAATVVAAGCGLYFTSVSSGLSTARWTSSPLPGFSRRQLQEGDLLRFDTGIVYQGYLSDFGRAVVVGEPTSEQRRLLRALHAGLDAAIDVVKPGTTVRNIVAAGEAALADAGVRSQDVGDGGIVSSFPVHWGHGLGLGWERPWLISDEEMLIEPGMYLAIERALTLPGVGTVAAEQTLLVGEHGSEILTEGPSGRWS